MKENTAELSRWLLLATLLSCLSGCTEKHGDGSATMTRFALQHDGLEREYFVYLPSSYDDSVAVPAVVYLHGYGGTATGTESEVARGLNDFAELHGFAMIYPQGTWFMSQGSAAERYEITSWNHISDGFDSGPAGPICTADVVRVECPPECGTCGACGWTSCHDDVGFIKVLVAHTVDQLRIDPARVSVAGFSNGAMMAHRLACDASNLFSAAVLVAGRLEPGFECTPGKRMPLLQMNGTTDNTVPFDGRASDEGYFFASSEAVSAQWTDGLVCGTAISAWQSANAEGAQCDARCAATAQESLDCVWADTNHRWPGTRDFFATNGYCVSELQAASLPDRAICTRPDADLSLQGSKLMFEFLDRHNGS